MIVYVDTSTLLKLIVDEAGSDRAAAVWTSASAVVSVSLVGVEARAALGAAKRGQRLTTDQHRHAVKELAGLLTALHIVEVNEQLIKDAAELAEEEGLRGYDAVHLAAALQTGAVVFSSANTALWAAAGRRGLNVANPLAS